ncbi:MAG TPA: iron-sulfur cluster assembly protein [Gammaproteobacteria bacterium]|nr:iron-sulfur cluster assembly protein [Gammaproteobacteria bacterium]
MEARHHHHRQEEVWEQLAKVTDPELDQAVTELDFIDQLEVGDGGDVRVRFRLPTYWCAANFAFMMASDMKERVGELPWVNDLRVELLDHFYADAINRGIAEDASFQETCGGEAQGSLQALRTMFRRKAFLSRQERLLRHLRNCRTPEEELVGMSVRDLADIVMLGDPDGDHLRSRYLEMRRAGPPDADGRYRGDAHELAFVTAGGEALTVDGFRRYLWDLRSTRANTEFNAHMCRSVLEARKGSGGGSERAGRWPEIRVAAGDQNE